MGRLENGEWTAGWSKPGKSGAFERGTTKFRERTLVAERDRYHLYVSYACPWAHRTLIVRALRGLEDAIPVTVVDPKMGDDGWAFSSDDPDPIFKAKFLREIYLKAQPDMTGHVTVPVLWDKKKNTIVNNESREIIRMFDVDLASLARKKTSLAPMEHLAKIDETLDAIYMPINNGVYRCGFATTQSAYDDACHALFTALDHWDGVLAKQRFTCGENLTEADIAFFTTLVRFDLVYYAHFKCNVRRLQDYPNLWRYLRAIYNIPEVQATCHFDHIKTHYYWSQNNVNPTRIVPLGPTINFES